MQLNPLKIKELRKKILLLRDKLENRDFLSKKIVSNLYQLNCFKSSQKIMLFASFRSEVNTYELIKDLLCKKQCIALPLSDVKKKQLIIYKINTWEDLHTGAYGILEPNPKRCTKISPKDLDVVIVPGSVFDRRGARYGYGGGYYDKFLSSAPQALRIALAFSIQVQDYIPILPHDQLMDIIVTENEILRFTNLFVERQAL